MFLSKTILPVLGAIISQVCFLSLSDASITHRHHKRQVATSVRTLSAITRTAGSNLPIASVSVDPLPTTSTTRVILPIATVSLKPTSGPIGPVNECPAIYKTLSADLTTSFRGSDGLCTDLARAAIRFAFHDAGSFSLTQPFVAPAGGGADGSLLLNPQEITRSESGGLQPYYQFLLNKFTTTYRAKGVGAADLIQFAAAHAIVTCPEGPTVKALVGRIDSSVAAPTGLLPPGFGPGSDHDSLLKLFTDKGFTAVELAALIGAHTAAKVFAQPQVPVGNELDSTPGIWDVDFYNETYHPPKLSTFSRLQSDINLSNTSTTVGKQFLSFVGRQEIWENKFVLAMEHVSVLGIPTANQANFIDCTAALPPANDTAETGGFGAIPKPAPVPAPS